MDDVFHAVLRVEAGTIRVLDENGDSPCCKNEIGTWTCERCGRHVRASNSACPAVPKEQRWRVIMESEKH